MRPSALLGTDVREAISFRPAEIAGEQYTKSHRRAPRLVRLGHADHAGWRHHEILLHFLDGAVAFLRYTHSCYRSLPRSRSSYKHGVITLCRQQKQIP